MRVASRTSRPVTLSALPFLLALSLLVLSRNSTAQPEPTDNPSVPTATDDGAPAPGLPEDPDTLPVDALDAQPIRPASGPLTWTLEDATGVLVGSALEGTPQVRHHLAGPDDPDARCGPLIDAGLVWFAAGTQLRAFDATSGRAVHRVALDGPCRSLTRDDETLRLVTGNDRDEPAWERSHTLSAAGISPRPRPSMAPNALQQVERMARRAAGSLTRDLRGFDGVEALQRSWPSDESLRTELAAAETTWFAAHALDPADPWPIFYLALANEIRGDIDGANTWLVRLMDVPAGVDTLRACHRLFLRAPELSDACVARSIDAMKHDGWIPEATQSLLTTAVLYLPPPAWHDLSPDDRRRWARRVEQLAPRAEGAWSFWKEVERWANAQGDSELASRAETLARDAWPTRHLAATLGSTFTLDARINLLVGLLLGAPLLLLLSIVRVAGGRPWNALTGWRRFVPTFWIERSVLAGFLLTGLLAVFVTTSVARDVQMIGVVASAPLNAIDGIIDHPGAIAFWDSIESDHRDVDAWRALLAAREQARVDGRPMPADLDGAALADAHQRAWRQTGSSGGRLPMIGDVVNMLRALRASSASPESIGHIGSLVVWLLAAIGLLVPAPPRPTPPARGPIWRLAERMIPGLSPRLGFLGPPVFALALGLVITVTWYVQSDGAYLGPLEAIAVPDHGRVYGTTPSR